MKLLLIIFSGFIGGVLLGYTALTKEVVSEKLINRGVVIFKKITENNIDRQIMLGMSRGESSAIQGIIDSIDFQNNSLEIIHPSRYEKDIKYKARIHFNNKTSIKERYQWIMSKGIKENLLVYAEDMIFPKDYPIIASDTFAIGQRVAILINGYESNSFLAKKIIIKRIQQ